MDQLLQCDISSREQIIQATDDVILYWVQPQCRINLWLPMALSAACLLLWIRFALKPKLKTSETELGTTIKSFSTRDRCSMTILVLLVIELILLKIGSGLGFNFYATYLCATLINQLPMALMINRGPDPTTERVAGKGHPATTITIWRILDLLVILDLPVQSMLLIRWFPISFKSITSLPIKYVYISYLIRLLLTGVRAYHQHSRLNRNQILAGDSDSLDKQTKPASDSSQADANGREINVYQIFNTLFTIVAIVRPHINYATMSLLWGVFFIRIVEGLITPFGALLAKKIIDQFTALGNGGGSGDLPYYVWFLMFFELVHMSLIGQHGFTSIINRWAATPIDNYIECELSHAAMTHIHKLSIDYHIMMGAGKLESIMQRGVAGITLLIKHILFDALPQLANLLCCLTLAYNMFDPRYYILLGFSALLHNMMTYTIGEHYYLMIRSYHESNDEYKSILTDSLTNFESVKIFTNNAYEATRYKEALRKKLVGGDNTLETVNILESLKVLMTKSGTFLVSGLCAYDVAMGKRSVSDLILLTSFIQRINEPIQSLADSYQTIIMCLSAIEKLVNLIQEQPSVRDPEDNRELILDDQNNTEIVFDKVAFGYKKEGLTTLKDISFKVPSGKVAALVGPSGGGKSTIMKLLLRFYDPRSGSISIGGQRIDQVTQDSLRRIIGVVPQDTPLFNDTIAYNIKYGNLEASPEELIEAAKLAQIHDPIESFTDKYDTKVGERGLRLSGGEKQRVAIARAFIRKPSVILLDEATSALDTETERKLQQSLNQLTENRTALIIAHRLSTIIHADIIFCIQDGAIVEQGTHQELLALDGVYANMWQEATQ